MATAATAERTRARPTTIVEERTEEERYRIHVLEPCGRCGGRGEVPSPWAGLAKRRCGECAGRGQLLALVATTPGVKGVGTALVALADDRRDAGEEPTTFGVLDGIERRWISMPAWERRSG